MKITTLSLEDLLARWKLLHGWEPLAECATATTPKLDTLLTEQINAWYTNALLTLPPAELPLTDFAPELPQDSILQNTTLLSPPAACLRPVTIRLSNWTTDATITPHDPNIEARQKNPFTAATPESPIAMLQPTGEIALYPADPDATITTLIGIATPTPGIYRLTPTLLTNLLTTTPTPNS